VFFLGIEVGGVGVGEAAQGVLEVDDMVGVVNHPGGVFGADDEVKVAQVEPGVLLVALDKAPEVVLGAGQLDEFDLVLAGLVEGVEHSPPEFFGSADDKGYAAGGDEGDFHVGYLLRFFVLGYGFMALLG
jgi:hypothetical protein